MKNILFFHQSADLYGSDKVLLSLLMGLDKTLYKPIVLLPCHGMLSKALEDAGIEYYVIPLVRAGRQLFTPLGLLRLPFLAWRSIIEVGKVIPSEHIHLVHSNTLAVLSGALWARLNGVPHIWHVHEIIEKPWLVKKCFGWLLRLFADKVVCNSTATLRSYTNDRPEITNKSTVVYNGAVELPQISPEDISSFRNQLGIDDETILITLVGRINRLKGQKLLVEAAERIVKGQHPVKVHFLMVGSPPPNQEWFESDLRSLIDLSPAKAKITLMPFVEQISTVWAATDIAAVPSTEPESFGMVAMEAMAASKPVIAADHGGLREVVVNGQTGILVKPGNATALANAISKLMSDTSLRETMGRLGASRFHEYFSLHAFISGMESIYKTSFRDY